jgi:hypothetical protein
LAITAHRLLTHLAGAAMEGYAPAMARASGRLLPSTLLATSIVALVVALCTPASAAASAADFARGNRQSDSLYTYEFSELDRLSAVQTTSNLPVADRVRVEFEYDYAGRRTLKRTRLWDVQADNWQTDVQATTVKFAYSGWLLVAELKTVDGQDKPWRTYVWGQDASGGLGGAGGIGGLLAVNHHDLATGEVTATFWPVWGNNGNITGFVAAPSAGSSQAPAAAPSKFGSLVAPIQYVR